MYLGYCVCPILGTYLPKRSLRMKLPICRYLSENVNRLKILFETRHRDFASSNFHTNSNPSCTQGWWNFSFFYKLISKSSSLNTNKSVIGGFMTEINIGDKDQDRFFGNHLQKSLTTHLPTP